MELQELIQLQRKKSGDFEVRCSLPVWSTLPNDKQDTDRRQLDTPMLAFTV